MDIQTLIQTNPQDHNPAYRVFRTSDLPLDLPVPEVDDMASATALVKWHYQHNISRAVCIVLHLAGYREIASYDREWSVTLDLVKSGQKVTSQQAAPLLDREWVTEQPDGTLALTPSGMRLWQILPPALRSPEPTYSGSAAAYVQAELAKLPAFIKTILATKIEPCPTGTGEICPKCGEIGLSRFQSKKKRKIFFWHCDICDAFFGDDAGKPGGAFSDNK